MAVWKPAQAKPEAELADLAPADLVFLAVQYGVEYKTRLYEIHALRRAIAGLFAAVAVEQQKNPRLNLYGNTTFKEFSGDKIKLRRELIRRAWMLRKCIRTIRGELTRRQIAQGKTRHPRYRRLG